MTLRIRRFLYILFILLFFTITPLVSFYAAGYKLNLKNLSFEKTGILALDSEPRGAKIYIDGEPVIRNSQKYTKLLNKNINENDYILTPAKIKNLLPGKYLVELKYDNYNIWSKNLEILPGNTTFAEDIVLFKISDPKLIQLSEAKYQTISPNKKNLAFAEKSKINLLDLDKNQIASINIATTSQNNLSIIWSDLSDKIIYEDHLYSVKTFKDINLKKITNQAGSNFKFEYDGNRLFYQLGNSLNEFNLDQNSISSILKSNNKIIDFAVSKNFIFIVENESSVGSVLKILNFSDKSVLRAINLPLSKNYNITSYSGGNVFIKDKNFNALYIIDPKNLLNPIIETLNNVKQFSLINDNLILYYNDYEIWTYEILNRKKNLLTRLSKEINDCLWHPSNNYIIFSNIDGIFGLELDNREKRNIFIINNISGPKYLQIDKKGTKLYFQATIGQNEGLYSLPI